MSELSDQRFSHREFGTPASNAYAPEEVDSRRLSLLGISHRGAQGEFTSAQNYPDEGIIIAVRLPQNGSADIKTVSFHDGPGIKRGESQDTVTIFLSNEQIIKCARKSGIKDFHSLFIERDVEIEDEILCDLAMCLNFNQRNPGGGNSHFAEQIVLAICAHVVQKYGQSRIASGRTCNQLAPWQLRIAKKMLSGEMNATPNLTEVANACRISTRHFTRSFIETVGPSPHQWSVLARLERAKTILEDHTASLAETAVSCGFSDQSHFTRVFTREFGTSPARWRRTLENT